MKRRAAAWVLALLVSAGLFITSHLSRSYWIGAIPPCGSSFDCGETIFNPRFHVLGQPLAYWGLAFYSLMAILVLVRCSRPYHRAWHLLTFVSFIGVLLSNFSLMTLSANHLNCPWCISSAAVAWLACAVSIAIDLPREPSPVGRPQVLGMCCVLVVGGLAGALSVRELRVDRLDPRKLQQYSVEIAHDQFAVGRGKFHVVVFGEIACPSCRIALGRLLKRAQAGQTSLSLRHLPILSQPISREACRLGERAKVRASLDRLIQSVEDKTISTKGDLDRIAEGLGLQEPEKGEDRFIDEDEALAKNLGITNAPTILLLQKGRLPRHVSLAEAERIIEHP